MTTFCNKAHIYIKTQLEWKKYLLRGFPISDLYHNFHVKFSAPKPHLYEEGSIDHKSQANL